MPLRWKRKLYLSGAHTIEHEMVQRFITLGGRRWRLTLSDMANRMSPRRNPPNPKRTNKDKSGQTSPNPETPTLVAPLPPLPRYVPFCSPVFFISILGQDGLTCHIAPVSRRAKHYIRMVMCWGNVLREEWPGRPKAMRTPRWRAASGVKTQNARGSKKKTWLQLAKLLVWLLPAGIRDNDAACRNPWVIDLHASRTLCGGNESISARCRVYKDEQ